jgi:hypothetical protein
MEVQQPKGSTLTNPSFTLGFKFNVNSPIVVTSLGLFDDLQNGLAESHALGLWNSSGTRRASTTVGSGTSGTLVNRFRYVGISNVPLTPGTYQIRALFTTGADPLIFPGYASGFQTAPQLSFLNTAFALGGTLTNPTSSPGNDPGYFGPNFQFSAVPTPTAIGGGLMLLGAVFTSRIRGLRD